MDDRVVIIGREGDSTAILLNYLATDLACTLILEAPISTKALLRSRVRRLGLLRVAGQVLFQVCIALPMGRASSSKKQGVMRTAGLSNDRSAFLHVLRVPSVNHPDCIRAVKQLDPAVVVINGTRIVKASTLKTLGVPVLNMHVGITPRYCGVHGAYWALVNDDPEHCGVTVHLVDEGIDTGAILYQKTIQPSASDNFTTYPLLQLAAGVPLLRRAIMDVFHDRAVGNVGDGPHRRWYHPTLIQYVRYRWRNGVR